MILMLGGTAEARRLAGVLVQAGLPGLMSLSGATRDPLPQGVPVRIGGFGGDDGFETFLDSHPVTAVIDATHPFAARITARTARICAARRLPLLRLERPGWQAGPGDQWTRTDSITAALQILPPDARLFCATGRGSLTDLAAAPCTTYLRIIDPPEGPYPHRGDWQIGRPPFDRAAEAALFVRLGVSHLLVKDSGGWEGRGKLDAARDMNLPVLMVNRPKAPPGLTTVSTPDDAVTWLWQNT
jgi:precorrin-6A/cobalt-precorrin-6A reductase